MLHEHWASRYGEELTPERCELSQRRSVDAEDDGLVDGLHEAHRKRAEEHDISSDKNPVDVTEVNEQLDDEFANAEGRGIVKPPSITSPD